MFLIHGGDVKNSISFSFPSLFILYLGFPCVGGYANATNQGQLNSSCRAVIYDGGTCTETSNASPDVPSVGSASSDSMRILNVSSISPFKHIYYVLQIALPSSIGGVIVVAIAAFLFFKKRVMSKPHDKENNGYKKGRACKVHNGTHHFYISHQESSEGRRCFSSKVVCWERIHQSNVYYFIISCI